tara:strand:- start:5154 stop:6575 length:1422 start_codon:yes stop_codon:yes gene_type:complete
MASKSKNRITLAEAEAMSRRDKRKIIIMSVGAVVILGAFLYAKLAEKNKIGDDVGSEVPIAAQEDQPVPASLRKLSEEDRAPLAKVRDDTEESRALPYGPAVQLALDYSNFWTPQHYDESPTRDLTPSVIAELDADSDAFRLLPFRARGVVDGLRERNREGASYAEYHGQIELEDGGWAAFIVVTPPESSKVANGDFVMLEGLFVQRYRFEGDAGWIEAPLICGKNLVRSAPRTTMTADSPTPLVDALTDDRVGEIGERPWAAEFELMAKAKVEDDGIDWATVPELNTETINAILADGDAFRGKPFRMPVSINLDTRSLRVDENSSRLDRITESWIANQSWKSASPAIKISLPEDRPELGDRYGEARYLEAELIFLRTFVFESESGSPGRAPWFVARKLEPFQPVPDPWPQRLMWGMMGITSLLVILIWALLRRDKAQSERLQADLVRRRRARRERSAAGTTPAPSGGDATGG